MFTNMFLSRRVPSAFASLQRLDRCSCAFLLVSFSAVRGSGFVASLKTARTHCSEEYAARHFGRFLPRKGPANPSEVGVHVSCIFCSFEFSRDRDCHGTRTCPHGPSSDKLLRVAVASQLRVSLHAWRLPRRFKNESELWRRCSTPQYNTQDHTHIHTNISKRHTNRATHHKNKTCTRRSMEKGGDGVVRGARVQVGQIFQIRYYYLPT